MPTIRIAVASTPLTATLEEAVPAAVAAVEEAGRLGARIVCLPETSLPGHRLQARDVPDVSRDDIERALDEVAAAAARAGVVAIVGAELPTPAGREIVAVVLDADGTRLGRQAKTQIAPSEEPHYVAGSGRRTFTAGGATFGIAICHEAGRYPEVVRAAVQAGAQVVFVPTYVTTEHGGLPERWCDPASPYEEKAHMCRALENTSTWRPPTRPARTRARRRASSTPTARWSPRCRTARSASRSPTSISSAPTACWRTAGRRSATRAPTPSR